MIAPLESQADYTALHDPAGQAAQFHELPDGSGVITFSEQFSTEHDWRVGDEIAIDPELAASGLFLRNISAEQRKKEAT